MPSLPRTHQQAHRRVRSRRALVMSGVGVGATGAMVLSACGPAGGTPPATSKANGTPEFWQWGSVYNDGFQALVDEFNAKQTGVTVTFLPGATQDYWNKLTAALAGSVGPDLFLMNGVNALAWASRKQVRDLSDLRARDKAAGADLQAVVKAFTEFYQSGGKLMGWPWDFSAAVTATGQLAILPSAPGTDARHRPRTSPASESWCRPARATFRAAHRGLSAP
jgi:ABC-type glycerol-3-phosphate transport system substrate-binding protein